MTKPIFAGNDLEVGVGPLTDREGNLVHGLTIRAWLSDDPTHTIGAPPASNAVPIHADLDVNISESDPGVSGDYPAAIDKLKINAHLIDGDPSYVGEDIYLHREDSTGYHTVERCRVYAERWAMAGAIAVASIGGGSSGVALPEPEAGQFIGWDDQGVLLVNRAPPPELPVILARDNGVPGDDAIHTDELEQLIDDALAAPGITNASANLGKKVIQLDKGIVYVDRPVLIERAGGTAIATKGAGREATGIVSTGDWYGPMFVQIPDQFIDGVHPGFPWPEFGPSLYAGGSRSMLFEHENAQFLALHDTHTTRLHGLGAFTIEFRVKPTVDYFGTYGDSRHVFIVSHGRFFLDTAALSLIIQFDNVVGETYASVNIGGTLRTVTLLAGQLTEDVTYDVCIDYDGSKLRGYLAVAGSPATMTDGVACTGTVTQSIFEDFTIGSRTVNVFELGIEDRSFEGYIENIRISNVARYASDSGYTPSATLHTWDANTLFLCTFAEEGNGSGPFVHARTLLGATAPGRKFWMLNRWNRFTGAFGPQIEWSDMTLSGAGTNMWFLASQIINSSWKRMQFVAGNARSLLLYNNCFLCDMEDLYFNGGGAGRVEACVLSTHTSGVGKRTKLRAEGGIGHFADVLSGNTWEKCFSGPSTGTAYGMYIRSHEEGDAPAVYDCGIDQENLGADWIGALILVNPGVVTMMRPEMEGQSQPAIIMDNVKQLHCVGGRLNASAASSLLHVRSRGEYPATFEDVVQRTNVGPPNPVLVNAGFEDAVVFIEGAQRSQGSSTFVNGDTTPDVHYNRRYLASNTGATSITDFDAGSSEGPRDGWEFEIEATNGNTTLVHGAGVLELKGGINVTLAAGNIVTIRYRNSVWREVARNF